MSLPAITPPPEDVSGSQNADFGEAQRKRRAEWKAKQPNTEPETGASGAKTQRAEHGGHTADAMWFLDVLKGGPRDGPREAAEVPPESSGPDRRTVRQ